MQKNNRKKRENHSSVLSNKGQKIKSWSFQASDRKGELFMTLVFFLSFMIGSVLVRMVGGQVLGADKMQEHLFVVEGVVVAIAFLAAVYVLTFVKKYTIKPFKVRLLSDMIEVIEEGRSYKYDCNELEVVKFRKRGDNYGSLTIRFKAKKYHWQARSGWNIFGGSEVVDIQNMEKAHKFLAPRAKNKE